MYQDRLREILKKSGKLSVDPAQLEDDSNLYEAGLTSLTTVNLMLAIEEAFDVEFGDNMLSRKTFQSIRSLCDALEDLKKS